MRLEEWQKWLDSQFLDSEEASAQEAVVLSPEPEYAALPPSSPAPEPPPAQAPLPADVRPYFPPIEDQPAPSTEPASSTQSTVSLEPIEPIESTASIEPTEPTASTPSTIPAALSTHQEDDEIPVPAIENYLPFLRGRKEITPPTPASTPKTASNTSTESTESIESTAAAPALLGSDTRAESVTESRTAEAPEPPAPARRLGPSNRRSKHGARAHAEQAAPPMAPEEVWSLVPRHLRSLVAMGGEEVAQNSYKRSFKETRIDLIQRILDPTLSLEETARLLNVCPTTVRRYTNRGLLRHQRTVGDQRRFKLSDVLAFLDSQSQPDHQPSNTNR